MGWGAKRSAVAVAFLWMMGGATAAWADPKEDARAAYEAGERAATAGDFAAAARSFARADELAPNLTALESALEAALRADDVTIGMELVERANRDPAALKLRVVSRAREKFAPRAGRLEIACAGCTVTLDGAPVPLASRWVTIGKHAVALEEGGRKHEEVVEVIAGRSLTVRMPEAAAPVVAPLPVAKVVPAKPSAPAPPPEDASESGGMSPAFFFVGLGLTAAAGGVLIAFAVDAKSKHDEFADAFQAAGPSPEGDALAEEGQAAQTRTNVMIAVTGGTALVTAALGIFADWSGSDGEQTARLGVVATDGGALLTWALPL